MSATPRARLSQETNVSGSLAGKNAQVTGSSRGIGRAIAEKLAAEGAVVDDYDFVFNANTKGVFFILQEAARRVRDGGHLLVTSTGGGVF